jgi:diadenosine tetraphosphatase ApaH/serine/threonine PP2A family protein phosphatase
VVANSGPRSPEHVPTCPSADEMKSLLSESSERLAKQPSLVSVGSDRVVVVGDTHGDLLTSQTVVDEYLRGKSTLIFLGDYVDRGPFQLENLLFLLTKANESPKTLFLLRGNHEAPEMNKWYGFYDVVRERYGAESYGLFSSLFSQLPVSAVVNEMFLAVHGGIATSLSSVSQLADLPKGVVTPTGIYAEILWNDPDETIDGFAPSPRGPGIFRFGADVVSRFLEANHLKALLRSHEARIGGTSVELGGRVYTVFSCRYYDVDPGVLLIEHGDVRPHMLSRSL